MYNIIELKEKDLSDLQNIAGELGIQKTNDLSKDELVYRILDEQAIVSAAKKASAAAESPKNKRSRVTVKQGAGRVYTANQSKAAKIEEPSKVVVMPNAENETKALPAKVETKETKAKAPKAAKQTELFTPETTDTTSVEASAEEATPKKKGRKTATTTKANATTKKTEKPAADKKEIVATPVETEETLPAEVIIPASEPIAKIVVSETSTPSAGETESENEFGLPSELAFLQEGHVTPSTSGDKKLRMPSFYNELPEDIRNNPYTTEDFIPIEDLPIDDAMEIPQELFGKFEATNRFNLHTTKTKSTIAFYGNNLLTGCNGCTNCKSHTYTHYAPSSTIETVTR